MRKKEVTFGTKLGIIAAAAGSAVGLGNIWRFPSQAASGGGAIFLILYVVCVLAFGVPLLISEFMVGRAARTNASWAFGELAPGTAWRWVGWLGVVASFIILGYYVVVCAWTVDYIWESVTGELLHVADFKEHFTGIQTNFWSQVIPVIIFTAVTAVLVIGGVKGGIERSAKFLMPLLFLLLIVLAVRAVTLPGAEAGLIFFFRPRFENVTGEVFLGALAQTFFSLSVGMGCMITYGSYCKQDTNLPRTAVTVALLDSLVAVLAGLVIFPSAFALAAPGHDVTSELIAGGPGLLFITVPKLFVNMPGAMVWSALFFLLLAVAALTSTISLMEVSTVTLHEKFGLSRSVSTVIISVGIIIIGVLCSYSEELFYWADYVTAKMMLPIGALFTAVFVGWRMDRNLVRVQFTNNGTLSQGQWLLKGWAFTLRYIAPVAILVIFIYGLVD